jgi:LmbE family N-acetylglucosaminyl deacetylase
MPGTLNNQDPDALMNAPLEDVAGQIACHIRRMHPDVVITHDPVGNYFHPDHIATHQATVKAFYEAADPAFEAVENLPPFQSEGLYFYTFARKRMKWLLWIMPLLGINPRKTGRNGDIDMEKILNTDFPIHVEVRYKDADILREQASRCHASQGGGQRTMTMYGRVRRWLAASRDTFMQAYPQPNNGHVRKDFFE